MPDPRYTVFAGSVFRRKFALSNIANNMGRIAFGWIAPSSGAAEDVPKNVALPNCQPAFRGQFSHFAVAPEWVHRGRAVTPSLQTIRQVGTAIGAQLQNALLGKKPVLPNEREPAAKLTGATAVGHVAIAFDHQRIFGLDANQ